MMAAFCTSVLFLACYLYYHIVVRDGEPTYFTTPGWPKAAYSAILFSHTVLAVAVAVLAPMTLYLGFGRPGNRHKRIARWTFPIWLYVSVTGVVVYVMLYHLYPPADGRGYTERVRSAMRICQASDRRPADRRRLAAWRARRGPARSARKRPNPRSTRRATRTTTTTRWPRPGPTTTAFT